MSYQLNPANHFPPSYSGVTINISNPALNMPPNGMPVCTVCGGINSSVDINSGVMTSDAVGTPAVSNSMNLANYGAYKLPTAQNQNDFPAYPPQYYMGNYESSQVSAVRTSENIPNSGMNIVPNPNTINYGLDNRVSPFASEEVNTDTSKAIINGLDTLQAEQKELEKNSAKTKITALTNEYIMSLENYLNNPNSDIRLMASKEVLTRLDEDRSRYDDAALNALLNKMLQDPNKLVRIAALSALSAELACGNDYTIELLTKIQNNPNSDPEDVLEASQILLKRSAVTEEVYVPVNNQQPKAQEE